MLFVGADLLNDIKQAYLERSSTDLRNMLSVYGTENNAGAFPDFIAGRNWFDCIKCHEEQQDSHKIQKAGEIVRNF